MSERQALISTFCGGMVAVLATLFGLRALGADVFFIWLAAYVWLGLTAWLTSVIVVRYPDKRRRDRRDARD